MTRPSGERGPRPPCGAVWVAVLRERAARRGQDLLRGEGWYRARASPAFRGRREFSVGGGRREVRRPCPGRCYAEAEAVGGRAGRGREATPEGRVWLRDLEAPGSPEGRRRPAGWARGQGVRGPPASAPRQVGSDASLRPGRGL